MNPDLAVARILRWIAVLSVLGLAAAWIWGGWRAGAAFAIGAGAAYLNFGWIRRLVNALGDASTMSPPRSRTAVLGGLRFLLLGLGAYVILEYSTLSLAAALAGLFVPVAAVLLEIVYELVYAS